MNRYNIDGLPSNYGLHKLLTVRKLSIDYKHRDSELFLRSPNLLDEVLSELNKYNLSLRDLISQRSMVLRYIYDIPRDVFDNVQSESINNLHTLLSNNNFLEPCFNVYLDFSLLVQYRKFISKDMIAKSVIISDKATQREMINYFTQHDLPIPYRFETYNDLGDVINMCSKALSVVLVKYDTLSEIQIKTLWALNHYVYSIQNEDERNYYYSFKFKTNTVLDKAVIHK